MFEPSSTNPKRTVKKKIVAAIIVAAILLIAVIGYADWSSSIQDKNYTFQNHPFQYPPFQNHTFQSHTFQNYNAETKLSKAILTHMVEKIFWEYTVEKFFDDKGAELFSGFMNGANATLIPDNSTNFRIKVYVFNSSLSVNRYFEYVSEMERGRYLDLSSEFEKIREDGNNIYAYSTGSHLTYVPAAIFTKNNMYFSITAVYSGSYYAYMSKDEFVNAVNAVYTSV